MSARSRNRRPVVGIPTQTLQSLGGVSAEIPPSWVMSQRYVLTLSDAGAVPLLIPLVDDETLRGAYETLDAVFLPGGADIDPGSMRAQAWLGVVGLGFKDAVRTRFLPGAWCGWRTS